MQIITTNTDELARRLGLIKVYEGNFWHPYSNEKLVLTETLLSKCQIEENDYLYTPDIDLKSDFRTFNLFKSEEDAVDLYFKLCLIYLPLLIEELEDDLKQLSIFSYLYGKSKRAVIVKKISNLKHLQSEISPQFMQSALKVNKLPVTLKTHPIFNLNQELFLLYKKNNKIMIKRNIIINVFAYSNNDTSYGPVHDFCFKYSTEHSGFFVDNLPSSNFDGTEISTSGGSHRLFVSRKDAIVAKNIIIDDFNNLNQKEDVNTIK
jgi:hypothetical protein